ncbi:hypothetical protein J4717_13830 [Phaeobacter sp. HS012]|uniref:hypothetical protein n=1 Tax=unclassified Phaeobacter TaxID=2621772 RepID=UPI001B366B52|nr:MULTISPECIES: hypothetical protein [unclassified Phaeobacter]MBQ4808551.1 hypothetical protein [Phaeobacter sp. HS012]MBQ4883230.1 hypothetical protein [Phaeobacter sp. HS011]
MPDLTIDLPDELYDRFCEMAATFDISTETLVRQTITLKVGCNPSSSSSPISTNFLRQFTDEVLAVADKEPVHLIDADKQKYVLISIDYHDRVLTPGASES